MKKCFKCSKPIESAVPVHGLHQSCFVRWFKLNTDSSVNFSDVALRSEKVDSSLHRNPINTSFFHGTFKKYSATLDKRLYILKVQDKDYPELPYVEYLSNQIAQELGLTVPDFYLIRFLNEIDAFVVHNFMDAYNAGNLVHIYHFVEEKPFSCKTIIKIIEEKIGRIEAIKQFIWLCLFDALIGNHDRHGRNIAFIETRKGFEMAPFYDNPSYIGIEEQSLLLAQHNPKGKIATSSTNDPTMRDYLAEFHQMGYGDWIKEFQERVEKSQLDKLVANSFLSEKRKIALFSLIERRIKEFDHVN